MEKLYSILKTTLYACVSTILLLPVTNLFGQYSLAEADSLYEQLDEGYNAGLERSIEICNELALYYSERKDTCKQVKIFVKRSHFERNLARFDEAMSSVIQAQKLYDHSLCGAKLQADIWLAYSNLYCDLDDQKKADSTALLGIRLSKTQIIDKNILINLYMAASDGMYKPLEKSLPHLDTALQLAIQYQYPDLEQKILIGIGADYANNDNYEEALKYTRSALKVALERNAYEELGSLYNNIAGLSEDPQDVLMYIDSALYYAKKYQKWQDVQMYTENKAFFYTQIGDFEKAYNQLWDSFLLKDSLLSLRKIEAIAEMEHKYEAEKKANEIQTLKVDMLDVELKNLTYKRNQNKLIVGSLSLLIIAVFLVFSIISIRRHRNNLATKNVEIEKAREVSDNLLRNILPYEIAQELKEKGTAEARKFDKVSILFSDFKEFTQSSEKLSATELVGKINYCFKGFDEIMEKYNIEKIKTIGDAYMAAGGLPLLSPDSVKNTVLAGIEMQQFITKRKTELDALGEIAFEMRVGIHTGPVVAGIVGVKKFQYDVWGDTVNTASRMESNGVCGKVNISGDTYEFIKNESIFSFEYRGKIEAKGKGEMEMWFASLKNK